jgi:hypothetical protein
MKEGKIFLSFLACLIFSHPDLLHIELHASKCWNSSISIIAMFSVTLNVMNLSKARALERKSASCHVYPFISIYTTYKET